MQQRYILTEVFFHWDDVSSFKFIPVVHRGRCSKHRKASKRYRMASFCYSLDAAEGFRRFDCKTMTKSKKSGMMNCSLYHFLTLILETMYPFFFFNLKKTCFDSFLVVPPDGSRALQVQRPLSSLGH